VHREELDVQGSRRADGAGDGVGDVVQLEVEEDATAAAPELTHDLRALGRIELQPHLHEVGLADAIGQCEGRPRVGNVQRENRDGPALSAARRCSEVV
jgi:hypothetical protein